MTAPRLTGTAFGGCEQDPLLLLGPSLGTSARELWGRCAALLTPRFRVVGWDLPGHGSSVPTVGRLDVADLAAGVLALADAIAPGQALHVAGDSLGGAVTLQLALDHPGRVTSATVVASGARIGSPASWRERADVVRASGTGAVVTASATRWFAADFLDREPDVGSALLAGLAETDPESYAGACEALASFDLTDRLAEVRVPVLAIAGAEDVPTPVESLRTIAEGVLGGHLVVLDGVGHLAPAEAPAEVARLIHEHARTSAGGPR